MGHSIIHSMTRQEALDRYARSVAGKAQSAQYVAIVRRFLVAGMPWTREGLTGYARGLEKAQMAPSTIDLHLRTLHAFGNAAALAWPGVDWKWDKKAEPSTRVAAGPEFVGRLIQALPLVDRRTQAWLTLSVLYGCRAVELSMWSAVNIGRGEQIFIHRAKKEDGRWYWLPPAVRPLVQGAIMRPMRRQETYRSWRLLCRTANIQPPEGVAWHANRRGLVVAMRESGIDSADVRKFIGWKSDDDEHPMVDLYSNPTAMLGADGTVEQKDASVPPPPEDPRALDAKVWARHPFLPLLTPAAR